MIRLEMFGEAEQRVNKMAEAISASPLDAVKSALALLDLAVENYNDGGSIVLVRKDGETEEINLIDATLDDDAAPTIDDVAKAVAQPPGGAIMGTLVGGSPGEPLPPFSNVEREAPASFRCENCGGMTFEELEDIAAAALDTEDAAE